LAVNLTGFRNCLAKYTVNSLSPCYGLLTAALFKLFLCYGTPIHFEFGCGTHTLKQIA